MIDRSQRQALDQTKGIFPPLRARINDAVVKLEQQLVGPTFAAKACKAYHVDTLTRLKIAQTLAPQEKWPKPRKSCPKQRRSDLKCWNTVPSGVKIAGSASQRNGIAASILQVLRSA